MRSRPAVRILIRAILVSASLAAVPQASFIPAGYWMPRQPKEYEEFVRIHGNTGFLCVLDGKSSFRFTLVGDSITTPWDRKDVLVWYPSSGDIAIAGEEKGVAYSTRYKPTDSATYYAKCRDEEARIPVSSKPGPSRPKAPAIAQEGIRDALGRKAERSRRLRAAWDVNPGR